jgi:pyruvate ferredoxin oxidoreductase alpha subunit
MAGRWRSRSGAALQGVEGNRTRVAARVYGLGGKEFFVEDAVHMLREAVEIAKTGKVAVPYAYFRRQPRRPSYSPPKAYDPIGPRKPRGSSASRRRRKGRWK